MWMWRKESANDDTDEDTRRRHAAPRQGGHHSRDRLVSLLLAHSLMGLSVAPALAQPPAGVRTASARPTLDVSGNRATHGTETPLQRTVRRLRTPGRERETMETLGIDPSLTSAAQAQTSGGSVDNGRIWGLPWWAWVAIGAGAGWAATELDFGE